MNVIDRIDHAELGEVSLGRADDELVGGLAFSGLIREGDFVIVFEEYVDDASMGFMVPSDISVFREWDRGSGGDDDEDCFICDEEVEEYGIYSDGAPIAVHVSCFEQALECAELLIERNSAVVSAELI